MREGVTRNTSRSGRGGWSIGELAAHAGLPVKTVRYYSDIALLPATHRSDGGHRRYEPEALDHLRLIRRLRSLGVSLADISEVLRNGTSLGELAASEQEKVRVRQRELAWRDAIWQALGASPGPQRPRLLDRLTRVESPQRAHADLTRGWRQLLPPTPPGSPIEAIVSYAAPAPPVRPSVRQVLAYAEMHALVSGLEPGRAPTRPPDDGRGGPAAVWPSWVREVFSRAPDVATATRWLLLGLSRHHLRQREAAGGAPGEWHPAIERQFVIGRISRYSRCVVVMAGGR
ncbi:MerR family transcriptional regulator [Streptomyces sp. NPDC017979]|uniref:MerR family transcriptional regulator n=1 Tax=Streptomyces sp. NPDC017979 TaxID=3365024 RepID=UPI003796BE6B